MRIQEAFKELKKIAGNRHCCIQVSHNHYGFSGKDKIEKEMYLQGTGWVKVKSYEEALVTMRTMSKR